MLDKDLYDSWQSRMELYKENREHGRMILESVKNGPLIWPTIEENGVNRTKKYVELSTKKIQVDCDVKITNIILQGLPYDVYVLVNHHRVSKDLWEKNQLLMQGTRANTSGTEGRTSGQQRVVTCFNCLKEGHMERQYTEPKRKRDAPWKKYILVIMYDYSRFTWVKFLATNDEAPDFIIKFLKMIQVRLNATVKNIRTDNGTEFVNQTLHNCYESASISHETSVARTLQQNVDTPMVKKSKLDEDPQERAVDPTHNRGMAHLIEKHLHAVKRIFRYLRGIVNQGLWYSKDSAIALTAFADADYVGCQDTRRSTSRNIFTKDLGRERIKFLIDKLRMRCFTPGSLKDLADEAKELPNEEFVDLPFKDELVSFIKELGYSGRCEMLYAIYTDQMHQPWRTFVSIINRCISGKITRLNRLRESRAQILYAGVVIRDTPGVSMSKKKKAPAKADRGKGIRLLYDVTLTEAAQLKKVLKKSK
nr:uncharacterized mitochondrial protein AtMg00810-like [Tanacetum cinerariifolium]